MENKLSMLKMYSRNLTKTALMVAATWTQISTRRTWQAEEKLGILCFSMKIRVETRSKTKIRIKRFGNHPQKSIVSSAGLQMSFPLEVVLHNSE